ncbi:MAG: hypothetical protein HQL10_10960 [Nitrospirae bacterium]|nr:hypothetical protein [Nitrospirota bacterium]
MDISKCSFRYIRKTRPSASNTCGCFTLHFANMAELYFKLQVDAGLKELDEGKGITHEEVEKRMSKWIAR